MITQLDIKHSIGENVNVTEKELDYIVNYFKRILKLYADIDIPYDNLKPCCLCMLKGVQVTPQLSKYEGVCYGHGCYVDEYYIKCPNCGLRFGTHSDYYSDGKKNAIIEWNNKN